MNAPPLKEHESFARNPDESRSGSNEEVLVDRLRKKHYESRSEYFSTQPHRDPTLETVIRKLENGFRKMKITVTDEHGLNTTVFIDEGAALHLIDYLAENVSIRSTRSGMGWRASPRDQTPVLHVAKQAHHGGHTEKNH